VYVFCCFGILPSFGRVYSMFLDSTKPGEGHPQQCQRLLDTLRQSETALDARTLSRFCLQPYHTVRKTLHRMLHDGQLVSPARGLYTTPGHLCLLHFPATSHVPTAPTEDLPIPDHPPTVVAARFIAPVGQADSPPLDAPATLPTSVHTRFSTPSGKDGSTPLHPPTTSVSHIPPISIPSPTPHPPSIDSHIPTVATNQTDMPASTPSSESPVSTVASIPNQPPDPNVPLPIPEIPLEDRSPSVRIPPRKEPEIYPGW